MYEPEKLFRNVVRHIVATNTKQDIAMRIARYEAKHGKCKADDLRFFLELETNSVQQGRIRHMPDSQGGSKLFAGRRQEARGDNKFKAAGIPMSHLHKMAPDFRQRIEAEET